MRQYKHTTIHQCGLNGQRRVMPLTCSYILLIKTMKKPLLMLL